MLFSISKFHAKNADHHFNSIANGTSMYYNHDNDVQCTANLEHVTHIGIMNFYGIHVSTRAYIHVPVHIRAHLHANEHFHKTLKAGPSISVVPFHLIGFGLMLLLLFFQMLFKSSRARHRVCSSLLSNIKDYRKCEMLYFNRADTHETQYLAINLNSIDGNRQNASSHF